jgi:hypothetical protein
VVHLLRLQLRHARLDGRQPGIGTHYIEFIAYAGVAQTHRHAARFTLVLEVGQGDFFPQLRTAQLTSHSFTQGVQTLIDTLLPLVDGETDEEKHQEALRILSSITGAILIARALDNPRLSEQFLQSVIDAWSADAEKTAGIKR